MGRKAIAPTWSKELLNEFFEVKKMSTYEIAVELNTDQWRIRNALLYYGFQMRSKKEACQLLYDQGKRESPTKGTKRSEETKEKIGKTLSKKYDELDESQKKERSDRGKKYYNSLTEDEKKEFVLRGMKAINATSRSGSKFEKFVVDELGKNNIFSETQKTALIPNEDLRVDIYIRELLLCIEIDGPAHMIDVYNEPEKFKKRQERDREKNGLLTQFGYRVMRVRHIQKMSKTKMLLAFERILQKIEDIKENKIEEKIIILEL